VRGTPAFQAALAAHPDQAATLQAAGQGNTDLNDTSFISRLAPVIAHPFKVGFSDSMSVVFLIGAAIMVIGFVVVLLLPEIPLADRSASQARAAEAQAEAGAAAEAAPVPGAAFAEAIAERTEVAVDERNGLETLDPDADGRGRHNAAGDGEVRVPVDGHSGEGRHEANRHDGFPGAEADGRPRAAETDPTAEPVHGRPSAGT
jgi:hypothetical protein